MICAANCAVFFAPQGHVAFSEETGDRIAWTKIEQLQRGKYEVVAFYDQKVYVLKLYCLDSLVFVLLRCRQSLLDIISDEK